MYHDTQSICSFLTRGDGIAKTFTLKLIIQWLLQSCNNEISLNLTKTKALHMAYISKVAFNIDSSTIHSTLNLHANMNSCNLL